MFMKKMSNHHEIFDRNLVELCDLTHCNEILIDRCTERDVITRAGKDEIEIEKIMSKRNRIFYTIMRRKDRVKFEKLVEIMKENSTSQSGDVLDILEENQSGPSTHKCPQIHNPLKRKETSVWFNVHDPITSFVGRENELKELHKIVTRNADKDTHVAIMSQLSSVSGMGGIGKTTLAREYARRYASFFNNNIIWVNAETTGSAEESFRELADEIGVRSMILKQHNQKVIPISKVTRDTYEYFSTRKSLFVFDNVEDYKSTVATFIPKSYQPGKIRPYILMTSRKQRLVDDCKVLRLDVLAIEDAEKFITFKLQKCLGQIDDESVRKLADELQCLPLALQQAVSYIQYQVRLKSYGGKEGNYIEEYLKLLKENPKVPLNHEYQDDTMDDYAYTVMRTWDVTLKAIERETYGSQAIAILQMLSYFPPENFDIIEFNSEFSEEEIQHSCVILEEYSLINRIGKYINIHRLVQQVIRVQNKEKDSEEYLLGRCLSLAEKDSKLYYIQNVPIYWDIWKKILLYENLVIKSRFILDRIFIYANIKDLVILNSSLEILEKNIPVHELIQLYSTYIYSIIVQRDIFTGGVLDSLVQQAIFRLNMLIELGNYDYISGIIRSASICFESNSITQIPKFVRDIVHIISNYCYEHSAEIIPRQDDTPYYLVKFWLNIKELRQCRMCFKLLVLQTGAESSNNMFLRNLRHPVFENFHLFIKYLLQLGIITDHEERDFVREVLDFCRSLPSDSQETNRMEKVDILLCNILCLVLLNYNFVQEILSCVFKISVQLRNEFAEGQQNEESEGLWTFVQSQFEKTEEDIQMRNVLTDIQDKVKNERRMHHQLPFQKRVTDMTCALNSLVMIGTTSLVSSEWAQYVEQIIKLIGTYERILEIEFYTEDSRTSSLLELESISCDLEECCRPFVDAGEKHYLESHSIESTDIEESVIPGREVSNEQILN